MSLDVKVFWVEDEQDWLSDARACLDERLRKECGMRLGLHDAIGAARTEKTAIGPEWVRSAVANFAGYDLALIDFRLGSGETTGAHFAKELRDAQKHTEIIFYSGKDREQAARKMLLAPVSEGGMGLGLQGIYFVGRDDDAEDFVADCFPIMEALLTKVTDLTRMRGIMVAEMSTLEVEMLAELVMRQPEFRQVEGEEFMRVAREKHCVRAKERDNDLAGINANGRSARDLLNDEGIYRKTVSWSVMLHFAKGFADKGKLKQVKRDAGKLRQIRRDLAHLSESQLEEGGEEQRRKFLQIRKDILKCRQLLEDAFPAPPVTPE